MQSFCVHRRVIMLISSSSSHRVFVQTFTFWLILMVQRIALQSIKNWLSASLSKCTPLLQQDQCSKFCCYLLFVAYFTDNFTLLTGKKKNSAWQTSQASYLMGYDKVIITMFLKHLCPLETAPADVSFGKKRLIPIPASAKDREALCWCFLECVPTSSGKRSAAKKHLLHAHSWAVSQDWTLAQE